MESQTSQGKNQTTHNKPHAASNKPQQQRIISAEPGCHYWGRFWVEWSQSLQFVQIPQQRKLECYPWPYRQRIARSVQHIRCWKYTLTRCISTGKHANLTFAHAFCMNKHIKHDMIMFRAAKHKQTYTNIHTHFLFMHARSCLFCKTLAMKETLKTTHLWKHCVNMILLTTPMKWPVLMYSLYGQPRPNKRSARTQGTSQTWQVVVAKQHWGRPKLSHHLHPSTTNYCRGRFLNFIPHPSKSLQLKKSS